MKPFLSALMLTVLLTQGPAYAQQGYEPPLAGPEDMPQDQDRDRGDPLKDGLEGALQNLLRDVEPHMQAIGRELEGAMSEFGPVFEDLSSLMDDIGNYQAPERLENGDILIRRRADAPPPPPVGDALQNMLRPRPEDDPRLNPRRPADNPPRDIPLEEAQPPAYELDL